MEGFATSEQELTREWNRLTPKQKSEVKAKEAEEWRKLVSKRPRLAAVLKAIEEGDDTFYLLVKRFGSPSVGKVAQDLLGLDLVYVDVGTGKTGRAKKMYKLTARGRSLADMTSRS